MTDERRAHLQDLAGTLWPSHAAELGRVRTRGTLEVDEFLVLPSRHRPRLVVPTGGRAAASVVRHSGEGRHARARLTAAALAVGLRGGLNHLWRDRLRVSAPPGTGPTLVAHLSAVLGQDLLMGLHLGPARANRKPVVQLLSPEGRTVAYAKIAVDDLTDSLVRAETDALRRLAGATGDAVQVPGLLHSGTWLGGALLVQSALPVWLPRRVATPARIAAAVAAVGGVDRRDGVALTTSDHWTDLVDRVRRLPAGEAAARLRDLVRRLDAAASDVHLATGGSHGDFTPWNLAVVEDRVLVWDWERFRTGVPEGTDLLHHALQEDLVARLTEPRESARRVLAGAADRLAPLGVPPRSAAVTALTYGADLAARYLTDRQQEAGARLGDVGSWLLPALQDALTQFEEER